MKKEPKKVAGSQLHLLVKALLFAAVAALAVCAVGAVLIYAERISESGMGAVSAIAVGMGVFAGGLYVSGSASQRRGIYVLAVAGIIAALLLVISACSGVLLSSGLLRSVLACAVGCFCALLATLRKRHPRVKNKKIYRS